MTRHLLRENVKTEDARSSRRPEAHKGADASRQSQGLKLRADRSQISPEGAGSEARAALLSDMQRSYGNAYVNKFIGNQVVAGGHSSPPAAGPGLPVSHKSDEAERDAARTAEHALSDRPSTTTYSSANKKPLQRTSSAVAETLGSSGVPLELSTRISMEQSFGSDLSNVRVHTGPRADASARSVDALAYTVGNDIVFRNEHVPVPGSPNHLLAHELAHVVQNGSDSTMIYRQPAPSPTEVPMEAQIRQQLERELPADAESAILERKRTLLRLFSRLNEFDSMVLHGRLSARAPGDSLATLFHYRLATPTRNQLIGILLRRSRRADEPALEFANAADRFLAGLELIQISPRVFVDPAEHPIENVAFQLWPNEPFPAEMDYTVQFFAEHAPTGEQATAYMEQEIPWGAQIKLAFSFEVTAQQPGSHRVSVKILDRNQQVVRILRQTFEVETTLPQDFESLKDHPQYADNVVMSYYDPDRQPRPRGWLSKWIPVEYADGTIIDLNFSDFNPSGSTASDFRWDNGKIFPDDINPVSAPKLTGIKHAVDLWIDDYNTRFVILVFTTAVLPTITGVPLRVGPAPGTTRPSLSTPRPRPTPSRTGTPPTPTVPGTAPSTVPPVSPPPASGPAVPTPTPPIGGALRTPVTQNLTIVETEALIALDKAAQPGVALSAGEQQIVGALGGRGIVATPTTAGQFQAAGQRGTVPITRPIPHTPAQRQAILQDLEGASVGGAGGAADRELVADALLAETAPGVVPVFATSDHGIINGMARLSGINPARIGAYNVAEFLRYQRGVGVFTVVVQGRVLVIRPIQPIGPRR